MARGNLFLGQAKGRVGSVVFSRRNGHQISRTYNASPSNPKTRAQATQRAQFATVIAASQALKEVINNSFDGKKNGQESVNEFVSANLNDLRARGLNGDFVANEWLVPKGQSFIQPQPWIISKGNVGSLNQNLFSRNWLKTDIGTAGTYEGLTGNVRGFSSDYLQTRLFYKPGCQLTFVFIKVNYDEPNNPRYLTELKRVVFNQIAPTGYNSVFLTDEDSYVYIPVSYCDQSKTTLESPKPGYYALPNVETESIDQSQEGAAVLPSDEQGNVIAAAGLIVTYLEDTGYRHTASVMSVNADSYDYTTDAIPTYMNSAASKIRSSDYYTEQPEANNEDAYSMTLNEAVSAVIAAQGMTEKGVFIGQNNSYGPVAEGAPITLEVAVPQSCVIVRNSVKAYNGENPLGDDWNIVRFSNNRLWITGPMPTTTTFAFNVSFDVFDNYDNSSLGRAALRINVSKANS